ncbi:hypothetical protein STEG23_001799, partial [Scotinomys teguina]
MGFLRNCFANLKKYEEVNKEEEEEEEVEEEEEEEEEKKKKKKKERKEKKKKKGKVSVLYAARGKHRPHCFPELA